MKLIFAQGNPGDEYANSRHNVGFFVVDSIAKTLGAKWVNQPKFHAEIANVVINGEKAMLVKPTSYYNETGASARKIIDYFKIDKANDMLVIHDDLDLPFGTIRVRKQGSDAGNRGIKSLNTHLDPDFARIRIGTNNLIRDKIDDASFVLGKFNSDEVARLSEKILPIISEIIDQFCAGEMVETSFRI